MKKQCSKCKEIKLLDLFYNHTRTKDGKESWCKSCRNEYTNQYHRTHKRKRKRNDAIHLKANKKWKLKNPDKEKIYRDKWKRENSTIEKYHLRVHRALKRGIIKRSELCFICQKFKSLQAHHPDYSKPLYVIWLCHSCHQLVHRYEQCPSLEGLIPLKKAG